MAGGDTLDSARAAIWEASAAARRSAATSACSSALAARKSCTPCKRIPQSDVHPTGALHSFRVREDPRQPSCCAAKVYVVCQVCCRAGWKLERNVKLSSGSTTCDPSFADCITLMEDGVVGV